MLTGSAFHTFLDWSLALSIGYLGLLYLFTACLVVFSAGENRRRKTQAHSEDYDALLYSRFTIPVSIIVPAYNEQAGIAAVVKSLLKLNYPEYEVVVVNDGSSDETLGLLNDRFALKRTHVFCRKLLPSKAVRGIYRSQADPRLLVIDKQNGGKADALNCAINFARYRYVCCVDGDSVYSPNALIAGMAPAIKDPANVLGITSLVAVARRPADAGDLQTARGNVDRHLRINLQHLEILRAFLNNRLAWSRMGFMLCVSGAFAIWRRDVILEMGGFSCDFTCEDIEMTFRVLERYRREQRPGCVLSLPDIVGVTEGPESAAALVSQRARWQRVILETVWHYRRMLFNYRYGTVGFLGAPYFVLSECLGSLMQAFSLLILVLALFFRSLNWTEFLSLIGIQVVALATLSTVSLWMNDWSFRYYRLSGLVQLILITPFDLFLYRPILTYAHLKGLVQFLRGDKRWHRFDRNARPVDDPAVTRR